MRLRGILAAAVLALPALNLDAADLDRQQPVTIEAERVDIDERAGVSTYRGNVVLEQGSTRLQAEVIKVYTKDRRLARVVATGEPVHYRQRPEGSDTEVAARARRVEYTADDGMLELLNDATLEQGRNTFHGERIRYDTRNDVVHATGGEEGDGRVRVIIQPETLQGGGGAGGP